MWASYFVRNRNKLSISSWLTTEVQVCQNVGRPNPRPPNLVISSFIIWFRLYLVWNSCTALVLYETPLLINTIITIAPQLAAVTLLLTFVKRALFSIFIFSFLMIMFASSLKKLLYIFIQNNLILVFDNTQVIFPSSLTLL